LAANLREKRDVAAKIVLLENRLDGVMTNFNATLSQNALVRKDIDHLVRKKVTFASMARSSRCKRDPLSTT